MTNKNMNVCLSVLMGLLCSAVSAETKAWWRMNGTSGDAALPMADALHGYQFTSDATTPTFTNEVMASHAFTDSTYGTPAPDSSAENGSFTFSGLTKAIALSADDTAAIFETDENKKLKSFTVEMVFKANFANNWDDFFGLKAAKPNLILQFYNGLQLRSDYEADGVENKKSPMTGATFAISKNEWHHFSLTYDASVPRCTVTLDYGAYTWNGTWEYKIPLVTGSRFCLGKFDGPCAGMVIDELRISSGVLAQNEMLRMTTVREKPMDFLYPLNDGAYNATFTPGDLRDNELPLETVASGMKGTMADFSGYAVDADGARYDASQAAAFSGSSALRFPGPQFAELEKSSFTVEAFVQCAASSSFTLFSHGTVWSLALENGVPVWTCGGVSTPLGEADVFADGGWHHLALVSVRGDEGTGFVFYVDGLAVGTIPSAAFEEPTADSFAAFTGLAGKASCFRGTPSALAPTAFLRRETCNRGDLIGHWTLDCPGANGAAAADYAFPANHGLASYTFRGNATGCKASVTNEVPAKWIWNAADGRLVNGANRSSIFFNPDGSGNGSPVGLFATTGTCGFPDEYTVEFFAKVTGTAKSWCVLADFSHCWMLDTYSSATAPKADLRMDSPEGGGKVANTNGGPDVNLLGEWHHVAMTAKKQTNGKYTYTVYADYDNKKSVTDRPMTAYADYPTAALRLGWGNNANLIGLIDEFRMTVGALDPSQFMRAFTPRADLTALWFATGTTLSGADVLGGPAYLTATWGTDVTTSSDLPFGGSSVRFAVGDATVAKAKCSAAFSGGAGASVPAIATTGATSFTIEATVKGVGEAVGKAREAGFRTWAMGIGSDGKPYVRFDTVEQGSRVLRESDAEIAKGESSVDASAWHHLALAVDRSGATALAKLYVDGVEVASLAPSAWVETADDIKVGEGFVGNIAGLRFSPSVLAPTAFLHAEPPKGLLMIVR